MKNSLVSFVCTLVFALFAATAIAHEAGTQIQSAAAAGSESVPSMIMEHPGLPRAWIVPTAVAMAAIALWSLVARRRPDSFLPSLDLNRIPGIGSVLRLLNASPYPLAAARCVAVALFLLVMAAGFFGTPHADRNFATLLVWNLWWPLVIVSVLFLGSAWCAVCPWDALSSWIVRRRMWRRARPHPGLNLKVPRVLRNVWVALLLFTLFTWLELAAGVSSTPVATGIMALAMILLSLVFLFVFERKAFCRYACPVGRTIGFYSRVSPVALRPVDQPTCDRCRTMECFNGSADIEPCPTHLTMGGLRQNTYCLSCGNCVLSCPHRNVSWHLRPMGSEARERAVPQGDEAWFMLALLGITSFHGFTMMPFWDEWLSAIGSVLGDSTRFVASFTLSMLIALVLPVVIYALAVAVAHAAERDGTSYRQLFAGFAFTALPLAFAYHLAHNMSHLVREGTNWAAAFANPLGIGLAPLTMMEKHERMLNQVVPDEVLFTIQSGLLLLGFWLAIRIASNRAHELLGKDAGASFIQRLPLLGFIVAITVMNIWLIAQDMEMRF